MKLKYEIVSWACLVIVWCLVIAAFVFLVRGQMDRVLPTITLFILVMRFETWCSRRLKKPTAPLEPPIENGATLDNKP